MHEAYGGVTQRAKVHIDRYLFPVLELTSEIKAGRMSMKRNV
jgi:hypothetical protein